MKTKLIQKPLWRVKASWRATAKTFLVRARNEYEAGQRGMKSKESVGCEYITVLGRVDG